MSADWRYTNLIPEHDFVRHWILFLFIHTKFQYVPFSIKLKTPEFEFEFPIPVVISAKYPFIYAVRGELSKCSMCRYVYYCGRACQKEGWSIHKFECQNLKRIAPRVLPDSARILARLTRILEKGGNHTKSYYPDKINFRMFKDLMSHYSDIKNDNIRMDHLTSLYGVLFEYFGGEMVPNSAELMSMYGRMCVNSFSICTQELHAVGTGMYLAASIMDHSCKPNVIVTFEGTTLTVRNLEPLPYLDWSKVFISYIDVMTLKSERQKELETSYYFLCQCPKCLEPEPIIEMTGAACPNPNCDNCIDTSSIKPNQQCSKCNTTVTEQFLNEFRDVMEMTQMHLENMKETTFLDVCEVCLKKHKDVLYKKNVKHLKILDLTFDSSIEYGKFENAIKYGLLLINSFYEHYGKIHPLTGLLHLKLAKLLIYDNQVSESLEQLKSAKKILEVTHGVSSSLFREHLIPLYQQAILESHR